MEGENEITEENFYQSMINDNSSIKRSLSDSDIASTTDSSSRDCAVCATTAPKPIDSLHSVTIVGGETQIGNKYINTTYSEKVTVIVSDISSEQHSSEAQIIRDIQRNLEHESASASAIESHVNILYVLLTVGTIVSALLLYMFMSFSTERSVPPITPNIVKFDNSSYCEKLCLVSREEWGWIPSHEGNCEYVNANSTYIILVPEICKNREQCSEILNKSQDKILLNGTKLYYPLKYNFVIGGDERIYVGKAWDCGWEKSVQIAILFNNYYYTVSERQMYLTLLIINIGRQCGHIKLDSKLNLKCGFNCAQNMDCSRALNLTTRNMYYVESYEQFLEDSKQFSKGVCGDFSLYCIKVAFNSKSRSYAKDWVKCDVKKIKD